MDESTTDALPRVGPPPIVGRTLDSRYEIFDDIGSGHMAHVFRAWDHRLQHSAAVKILDERYRDDAEVIDAFEREANLAAGLPVHRNIVSVYAVGRAEDLPYIVMELVRGQNLKEIIAEKAPLPIDRAFEISGQVATGLEFAHQYGLVHRNLRPQNILVARTGEVKLTDFGLGSAADLSKTVRTLPLMVRAQYLAPEVALGKSADARSDIYALGVVLFEMLTDRLPFDAPDPAALASRQVHEQPPNPADVNDAIPPAAAQIVLRALDKDPGKRYRSAAAFAAALHEHLLLEKGETTPYLSLDDTTTHQIVGQQPSVASTAPPSPAKRPTSSLRAVPVERPRIAPYRARRITLTSLVFLLAVLIAAAGGWLAYRAIYGALNSSATASGTPHRHPAKHAASRPATSHPSLGTHPVAAGCAVGPVQFAHMWAETTQVRAGGSITFDYTIANSARQCRRVALALRVYSDTQPGFAFSDRAGARVVQALPGVHTYKRQFTFPPATAGQRFDVVLSLRDPSRTQVYGTRRINNLITVGS